jgi:hypothetical protein
VNFAKKSKKIIYNAESYSGFKPVLYQKTFFCKIGQRIYIGAGNTFIYDINSSSFIYKDTIKGNLLACDSEKKLLYYVSHDDRLMEYNISAKQSKYIHKIGNNTPNFANDYRMELVGQYGFFRNNDALYRYDINKHIITEFQDKECTLRNIVYKSNKLLCFDESKMHYYLTDPDFKSKKILENWDGGGNIFLDDQLEGLFYTRYDWDWLRMKEIRTMWFYSIPKQKSYFVDKKCHF